MIGGEKYDKYSINSYHNKYTNIYYSCIYKSENSCCMHYFYIMA